MKRIITTTLEKLRLYDMGTHTLESLKARIVEAEALIPQGETGKIELSIDTDEDGAEVFLLIKSDRLETDDEYFERIERNKRNREDEKKRIEEKERNLYYRLKAKYELKETN